MSNRKNLLVANAWICQISGKKIIPVFGDLLISDSQIAEIREKNFKDFISNPKQNPDAVINAGGRLATIPMINFHDHFYSRLAKGLPLKGSMENFKEILQNLWWKLDLVLDEEMIRASAQIATLESIRSGVTYIFDHHSSPKSATGSLKIISEVLNETGLHGVLCFESTDRNGKELSEKGLNENIEFINNQTNENIKGFHYSPG